MDDESFKTELLNRLDKIQSLLTYLCGAAKASVTRTQAEGAKKQQAAEQADNLDEPVRSLLQDEMQDDYDQAVQKWKSEKV